MPEVHAARGPRALAALLGLLLTAVAALGGVAALAGWLAQAAFARAVRRPHAAGLADVAGLLGLWGGALLAAVVLVAWPVAALRESGGIGAALALSVAGGLLLIGLWRLWPVFHAQEREGGTLAAHWRTLATRESGAWRGLGVAGAVVVVVASLLLLGWPGLLPDGARWALAAAMAVAWPLAHVLLQRVTPADEVAAPEFLDEPVEDDDALPLAGEDTTAALYAAARGGRVDRALALLDAGADPHALPPSGERDQRALPVLAAVLPDLRLLRARR